MRMISTFSLISYPVGVRILIKVRQKYLFRSLLPKKKLAIRRAFFFGWGAPRSPLRALAREWGSVIPRRAAPACRAMASGIFSRTARIPLHPSGFRSPFGGLFRWSGCPGESCFVRWRTNGVRFPRAERRSLASRRQAWEFSPQANTPAPLIAFARHSAGFFRWPGCPTKPASRVFARIPLRPLHPARDML